MLRILTIDDSQLFLAAFNDLLTRFPGVGVVASASNGEDGLAAIRHSHPDMVFVDMKMPGLSGLEVAERLHNDDPDIGVIVISLLDDEECRRSTAAVGAQQFVCKRELFDELPKILERQPVFRRMQLESA